MGMKPVCHRLLPPLRAVHHVAQQLQAARLRLARLLFLFHAFVALLVQGRCLLVLHMVPVVLLVVAGVVRGFARARGSLAC